MPVSCAEVVSCVLLGRIEGVLFLFVRYGQRAHQSTEYILCHYHDHLPNIFASLTWLEIIFFDIYLSRREILRLICIISSDNPS